MPGGPGPGQQGCGGPSGRLRQVRRALTRHRRGLAAACAAGAVVTAVQAARPSPTPVDPVVVAGRDLPAGWQLTSADLVTASWPRGTRPDGVLPAPVGRTLSGPLRRGEPVTDARLTGPGLLTGQPPGTVAVTVRLTDPAGTVLLVPGRRVDLLGGPVGGPATPSGMTAADLLPPPGDPTAPAATKAQLLAAGALVLAVPGTGAAAPRTGEGDPSGGLFPGMAAGAGGSAGGSGSGLPGIVIVAVDPDTAARLSAAAGSRPISVVVPN
ncbi:MAG TPA: SAF domain-containing protein [Kineosporiaceae bacterium]|nr:SAF domain-containing protein [Kineosporiaceae bacterium]